LLVRGDALLKVPPLDRYGRPLSLADQFEDLIHLIWTLERWWAVENHVDQVVESG
jgi:hypothetical protein